MAKTFPRYGVDYAAYAEAHYSDTRPFALFNSRSDAKRFRNLLNEDNVGVRFVVVEFTSGSTYVVPEYKIIED